MNSISRNVRCNIVTDPYHEVKRQLYLSEKASQPDN